MNREKNAERALDFAERLAATNAIGEEQAKVYAFREVFGFGRAETAERLDKSPNTVDNLRVSAARHVGQARHLIEVFEREDDLIEVRRSGSNKWHRDTHGSPHEPTACYHAPLVMLRQNYEYRVVPESELDRLSGELCPDCFSDVT